MCIVYQWFMLFVLQLEKYLLRSPKARNLWNDEIAEELATKMRRIVRTYIESRGYTSQLKEDSVTFTNVTSMAER